MLSTLVPSRKHQAPSVARPHAESEVDIDCSRSLRSLALVIWGFGLVWLILATSSVLDLMRREKVGFNMGWWGFTFPIGVFAVCTTQFGTELDSLAFKVIGTVLSCTVVALWMYVGGMTLIKAWTGVM